MVVRCACLAALLTQVPAAAADAATPDGTAAAAFIGMLAGDWSGRAVTTPAGPFEYDLSFTPAPAGCMDGSALPGGIRHEWRFCPGVSGVELEFLSHFGGNRRPLQLTQTAAQGDSIEFRAREPEFLSIQAQLTPDCLRLQVLHHGRLHVEIRVQRPTAVCRWAAAGPGVSPPGQFR